jgi:hypothetical protein
VFAFVHNRRFLMPLVIAMALVAIAVPTCRMVGCEMDMGAMPFMPHGAGFYNQCSGEWVTSAGPAGVVPPGVDTLMLTLMAAVLVAVVLFSPMMSARPVFAFSAQPPPPPEDPRGERFRV